VDHVRERRAVLAEWFGECWHAQVRRRFPRPPMSSSRRVLADAVSRGLPSP